MRRFWNDAELTELTEKYAVTPTKLLALELNRSERAVYAMADLMGLKKSPEYLDGPDSGRLTGHDTRGLGTRFEAGHSTWNAGLKGWKAGGRSVETQFKKGRPASEARNYKPIGSERVTKDGLLERKVTDDPAIPPSRRWIAVQRLVWEQVHGPIPKGSAVVFKAGMRTTEREEITVDRLELVTRGQLMRRNTVHRYPKEIAQLVQLRGALVRQINRRNQA